MTPGSTVNQRARRRPLAEYALVVFPMALVIAMILMSPKFSGGMTAPDSSVWHWPSVFQLVALMIFFQSLWVTHRTRGGAGLAAGLGLSILATLILLFLPALVLFAANLLVTAAT